MKLQLISDVHTEFHKDYGAEYCRNLPNDDVDVLVIAGDFGTFNTLNVGLPILCQRFKDVVFTCGNHELYASDFEDIHLQLAGIAQKYPNLHVLDGSAVEVQGQRFVGGTMWFPDTLASQRNWRSMTDFYRIRNFHEEVYRQNQRHCAFFSSNVKETDIVVTHHLPLEQSIAPQYVGNLLNCYFLCDQSDLIRRARPKLWCHGHTHNSFDYVWEETRVVCNPFGYKGYEINKEYIDRKIIEI